MTKTTRKKKVPISRKTSNLKKMGNNSVGKITHDLEAAMHKTAEKAEELQHTLSEKTIATRKKISKKVSQAKDAINTKAVLAKRSLMKTAQKAKRGDKVAIAQIAAPTIIAAALVGTSIRALTKRHKTTPSNGRQRKKAIASKSR